MVIVQSGKDARMGNTFTELGSLNQKGSAGVGKKMGKAKTFARNLKLLTALRGLKATTAAKEVQAMLEEFAEKHGTGRKTSGAIARLRANPVDAAWYRRMTSKGVVRSRSQSTWLRINALAHFFGKSYADLWDENLPEKLNMPKTKSTAYPIVTKQLHDLLASGRYDYLVELLASLHAELTHFHVTT